MQLALFTPGAYIWPVQRSLEAFLASLAIPARDELSILDSPLYPAAQAAAELLAGLPSRLDARLFELHRDLYYAMLRPSRSFRSETRCMADYFWEDLREAGIGALLETFMAYFTQRTGEGLSVAGGLSVVRAVFFNHEAAEPEHWLYSSLRRTAHLRAGIDRHDCVFTAPARARTHDLAFGIHDGLHRPPASAGCITGAVRRQPDGLCRVEAGFGVDPSLSGDPHREHVLQEASGEVRAVVERIFGWDRPRAEAAA
jgi:hypothetical protein